MQNALENMQFRGTEHRQAIIKQYPRLQETWSCVDAMDEAMSTLQLYVAQVQDIRDIICDGHLSDAQRIARIADVLHRDEIPADHARMFYVGETTIPDRG